MSAYRARRLVGSPRQRWRPQRPTVYLGVAATVLAALAVVVAVDLLSPGGASPAPAATGPATGQSSIDEGPAGRVALTRWTLRADASDAGAGRGWASGAFSGRVVRVPYVANAEPVTGSAGSRNYNGSIAWYRTAFTTPAAGTYALDFGSVNHRATVWLDGRRLGDHVGTYLPFEFLIHPAPGRHLLVVRADWRDPNAQSREGFHRTWFNFGGINREVSVRPVGASDLLGPDVRTQLSRSGSALSAQVDVSVTVHNYASARTITPSGTLSHGDQSVSLQFTGQPVAHGASEVVRARATIANPSLWEPGSPTLYSLSLNVGSEASYQANVGLRQLTWSRGRLYLNARPIVLHGASLLEDSHGHGDALTPADQDALVGELRAIGANATRSQHPLDPGLLERLDAAGIMVWEGVGPVDPSGDWTSNTPALMRLAERRVRVSVGESALHPSIVAWNLANEIAGNGHRGGQAQYVHRMTAYLHRNDPGRMVAVDVWGEHPPHVAGSLYDGVDAVGETNYAGWYDGPYARAAATAALIHRRLAAMQRTFPDKVRIISEFGAEANALNQTSSPGGFAFQARLIAQHVRIYRRDPSLSGMLVWDLRDFAVAPRFAGGSINLTVPGIHLVKGINQKGLFDYEHRPKPAAATVAWLYRRMPAY
jgi:beta-galactosidase/beta-glucuronidase